MSNLGSLRDRKRKPGFLGGRMLAAVVITVIAAVSFSLGYNVGRSGMEGKPAEDQVQVVPEGAGLVLLGGQIACDDKSTGGQSASLAVADSSVSSAVLETMKPTTVPEPDSAIPGQGPEEPVLEPIGNRSAKAEPATIKPEQAERRVAPIGQLPEGKKPEAKEEVKDDSPGQEPARTVRKNVTQPVKKATPETRKTSEPRKTVSAARNQTPKKKASTSRPSVGQSDGKAYSVQVGAFMSLSDARTHRIRFTNKGYKTNIYKDSNRDGSDIFKVRIGMFTSRTEAEKMALRLKSVEGVNGFVTAIE